MEQFKLEIEEKDNYNIRIMRVKVILIAFFIITLVLGYSSTQSHEFIFAYLLIGFIVIAIITYLNRLGFNVYGDRYFINLVEYSGNEIHIRYKDKMEVNEIKGKRRDFDFQKRWTSGRGSRLYLQIIYKRETIISQYRKGEWSEDKFDEIIKEMGPN